jgi:hypothetical protein
MVLIFELPRLELHGGFLPVLDESDFGHHKGISDFTIFDL